MIRYFEVVSAVQRLDKTQSEQEESAYPPEADIAADIAIRRSGPKAAVAPSADMM